MQLYAVGTTGDGSAPTALLTPAVMSQPDGSFTLQGLFKCPDGDPLVYITATGGNPGLDGVTSNNALALMAAIGHCSTLTPDTFIQLNEVTTVAAVAALAPFMSAPSNVGSGPADAAGLSSAFQTAAGLADISTGLSPGAALFSPSGQGAVPSDEIYSLANVLAACVNSPGGVATDTSTPCGKLLSLTGGTGDTLTALIALEKSPAAFDTTSIFNIATGDGVFQPTLPQAPDNFAVAVIYPGSSTAYAIVPQTFYPGETVYFYSTSSNCLFPQLGDQAWFGWPSSNFVQESLDTTRQFYSGGPIAESGCGRLGGPVPSTGLPYGPIGVYTLYLQNSQYNYGLYFTANVVPPPDQSLTFDKTTLFSNGGIGTAQFGEETHLRNNTSSPVTLGHVTITGNSATAFSIYEDTCSGATLQPYSHDTGAYCKIGEQYDPRVINGGLIQASLVVSDVGNTIHATAIVAGIGYPDE